MNIRRSVHVTSIILIISSLSFAGVAEGEGGGADSTPANADVSASPIATYANTGSPLGIELNGIAFYASEQPFLNIMKTGSWVTSADSIYDTGEENLLQLDADGYPTSMLGPVGGPVTFTTIQTPLLHDLPSPYYPAGDYVVLYEGTGTLAYNYATLVSHFPGRDVINLTASREGVFLQIKSTDPGHTGDYIRNIRVVYAPNEALLDSGEILNPVFINRVQPFRLLRFMAWMRTNNSTQSTWTGRPTPSNVFWSANGAPLEVMVSVLNKVHADGWFNMPAMATDDYITRFATYVHDHLDPDQKVYVEYSNETWYDRFSQSSFVTSQGEASFPSYSSPFQANRNYYGMRTAQICRSWTDAWRTDANRVICVLATEARDVANTQVALDCSLWSGGPCGKNYGIGAVAIGPYFGYTVPDSWTRDPDGGLIRLFQEINQGGADPDWPGGYPTGMIQQAIDWTTAQKANANSYGLDLIAYEGGQSLVDSDDALTTALYEAANQDPRMGAAYTTYLHKWKQAGGGFFSAFADIGARSKFGSWGALENVLIASSPKYDALLNFIADNPCWWSGCTRTGPSFHGRH
ncbi:MAG: cellulose-binding protein [Bradyrhizobium sp.]|uniref:hypothetical protein n=1 Tax=Bradyrhizobium sp. TaxID=376 RepID=UPI0011F43A9B|nr:hypothetical protein [Bradyrhizobium sp.]THD73094.1 MAG: cellulose-binding protein [Bradyrhizobium sp.]